MVCLAAVVMWRRSLNWWWAKATGLLFKRATVGSGSKCVAKSFERITKTFNQKEHTTGHSQKMWRCVPSWWVLREEFGNPDWVQIPPGKYFVVCFQSSNIGRGGFSSLPDVGPISWVYSKVKISFPLTNIRRWHHSFGGLGGGYIARRLICVYGDQICEFV